MKTQHPTKGIIAAGHSQTAAAAIRAFQEGGNAFDAAIAALFATFVTETCMSSPGGGAFANLVTQHGNTHLFDFFCQTPKIKRPQADIDFYPVTVDLGGTTEEFHIGRGASGVPGTIAGIYALHKNLCTLPLKILAEPAIEFAKEGAYIDDFQALDFQILSSILKIVPSEENIWLNNGKLRTEGDHLYMPRLADFLENLVHEGEDLFYKGEIAQKVAEDYAQNGGQLTRQDFEAYRVNITQPLRFSYKYKTILTTPYPSMGGALIALSMPQLQKHSSLADYRSSAHVEALYHTYAYLNDLHRSPQKLREALQIAQSATELTETSKRGSTTHFSIADENGNAIAITVSNGEGNGYIIPNTDIMMNNMLGEAALLPNGFHSWSEDVRLTSMMTPTIVLDDKNTVEIVTGSGGAGRIPGVIMQVLHYLIDHQMSVTEAVQAPRLHLEHQTLNLEPHLSKDLAHLNIPQAINHWEEQALFFGGVHTILKKNTHFEGVGDARRSGVVQSNF